MKTFLGCILRFFIPKSVQQYIDITRTVRVWRKYGIIFIHVPKNAGCSVNESIYERMHLGHHKAKDVRKYYPDIFTELPSIAIVRDPVKRFVSAYNFMRGGGNEKVPVNKSVTRLLWETDDINQFISEEGWRITELDYVFERQSDFILDDYGNCIVDKIFMIDEMNTLWEYLTHLLDKEVKPEYSNKTKSQTKSTTAKKDLCDSSMQFINMTYKIDCSVYRELRRGERF